MAKGALPFITQCLNCSWLKLNHSVWWTLYTITAPFKTSIHSDYDPMNRPRLQNQFELKTIWAEKSEISTYASFKSSVYEQSNTSVNLLADCNSFFSNSKQLKWQHISFINDKSLKAIHITAKAVCLWPQCTSEMKHFIHYFGFAGFIWFLNGIHLL